MYYWFLRYLITIFLLFSFIFDFEILLFTFTYFFIHLNIGLVSIFRDYVHFNELNYFFNFLVRIFLVFIFNLILEIIF